MLRSDAPYPHRLVPRRLLMAAGTFMLLCGVVFFTARVEQDRQFDILHRQVHVKAVTLIAKLESELNSNAYLANGLVAFVSTTNHITDDEMYAALKSVYGFGVHLRNIGIAPKNRIKYVYPLESNQKAIGLYYPDYPDQWSAVKEAIQKRTTVMAGPVKLKQGGSGLISRTPVFLENGEYWGILSLVIDTDKLFTSIGLAPEVNGIQYSLRGRDGLGEKGAVFLGEPALFSSDAIKLSIVVPGGSWQMAARPVNGWDNVNSYVLLGELGGYLLAGLIAWVVWLFEYSRYQLEISRNRLRSILDNTHDGVIVIDDNGIIQEFNPAAEGIFGYARNEMMGVTVNLIMENTADVKQNYFVKRPDSSTAEITAGGRQVNGRRKDGKKIPLEVTLGEAIIEGHRFNTAIVRDIRERMAAEDQLRELATKDSLTGVLNRRALLEAGNEAFRMAKRYKRKLSVLMIDADHFKKINDNYGHATGDEVLKRMTELTCMILRSVDLFGRMGGEEFIAIMPETGMEEAKVVAERLLNTIRSTFLESPEGLTIHFTVSIGIASLSDDVAGYEELISLADAALYRAKGNGRNQWAA